MSRATDRGILVIVSSPSGAGKTTLARRLLSEFSDSMEFSVSYTTRSPRPNEKDGVDYCFVDAPTFERMVANDEFAEWAEVHGNRYGTSRAAVERALHGGRDVVFDVDWQGGASLSAGWPADSLKIFILPPDMKTLAERLERRASDAPDVIARRLAMARTELTHHDEYDHLIVNDEIDPAYRVLRAVYLVRKFGQSDRDDVAHPLTSLARIVSENTGANINQHAESLIAERVGE